MIQELLYTPFTRMHPVRSSSTAESSMPQTFISSKGLTDDRCIWYGYVSLDTKAVYDHSSAMESLSAKIQGDFM